MRVRLELRGAVQGVGFRPFIYRVAQELGLRGWVLNDARGLLIEAEGPESALKELAERVGRDRPPRAVIESVQEEWLEPAGLQGFTIRHSDRAGEILAVVLPDVATCPECLEEAFDPGDRRYRYPFTNCTNCGPRFTIVEGLPYDRPNTTMRRFVMCVPCQEEYEDPRDRRFHAQPNACPDCGPRLFLQDHQGEAVAEGEAAMRGGAETVRNGGILALKGLGGFHLMVDARSEEAVDRLRERKGRWEKPLALMAPDLAWAAKMCEMPAGAAALLRSPEAPIVLLRRRPGAEVAVGVAPGNPYLGVMLPYTPLHQLLLSELGFPVVATSGNLSDEPICIDNHEALERLRGIADRFLVHDRPIARHADDSVFMLVSGEPQPVRRARGYAPLPVLIRRGAATILAVGAHLKNIVALAVNERVFLSQHIGDMETPQALDMFERVIRDFLEIYEAQPRVVAHDLHPTYPSTLWIREIVEREDARRARDEPWKAALATVPLVGVQHHHAHLASCLADNDFHSRALGVTWDGTGFGPDQTVWGGEFLLGDGSEFRRVARMRPFRLLGGEAAIKEPGRVSVAVLREMLGREAWELDAIPSIGQLGEQRRGLFERMLESGLHSPLTSSAGRLFDAVASLLDLHQRVSFEGQAAMALEYVADRSVRNAYPVTIRRVSAASSEEGPGKHDGPFEGAMLEVDWEPTLRAVLEDLGRGVAPGVISARFHNALVDSIVQVASAVAEPTVALTGGCFQNRLLTERARRQLQQKGFQVLVHRQVPANDGGISLGQVVVAAARLGKDTQKP
jgi:hydrogenase maturation protein HypF